VVEDEQPDRRRQVAELSLGIDRRDEVREGHTAAQRDLSLRPLQNASSRLTLVLWPAMTIDRLITGDFIARLPFRSGRARSSWALSLRTCSGRVDEAAGTEPFVRLAAA
jgi:hypothetical protein